jgi:hypothetical protein
VAAGTPAGGAGGSRGIAGARRDGAGTGAKRGAAVTACPRCHRPLDDGEVYVCCANVDLQWRCEACGKVSEGFAFPYGTCPQCGVGTLEHLERGTFDDDDGQDTVRMALEIEQGGRAFYERAAREAQ